MRIAALAAAWLASRAWLLWLLHGSQAWVTGDVLYFFQSLWAMSDRGLSQTLVEYPVPAVGALGVPWWVAESLGDVRQYQNLLFAAALATDLAFTVLLYVVARGPVRWLPPATWIAAVLLLGSTTLARFDLLPGILCGLAVLVVNRWPAASGVLAAVATGIKLWPGLIVPALLGHARSWHRVLAAGAATGAALVAISWVLGGWDRLVSPLAYQVDRGLQVESVLATPAVVAWWLVPDTWEVAYQSSKSFEVSGPAVPALLTVSAVASVLYLAGLGFLWWQLGDLVRRGRRIDTATTVWLVLASVSGFVVVGKVLSPQYLLWLAPTAAAGLAIADSSRLRSWTGWLLVAAGLTQVVFPWHYGALTTGHGDVALTVLSLAARNLLLAWLFAVATAAAWRGIRAAQRGSALDRQPSGLPGERYDERTAR
ncbi:glycosyltransferase 87 family protein [Nocardioides mesophilus]|uniref:DUF2029 domain-containing protein n=1 Tax=Nocardioides mesophilus TaxID=433659 RepID=A0A7G9RDJ3_9ACTN|nr:glycosyltransferase 87 family protein [Nocardioides mesophilus]QNN53668.1 DUF2029 domain-containing protein [Nocardioides mesophilus]